MRDMIRLALLLAGSLAAGACKKADRPAEPAPAPATDPAPTTTVDAAPSPADHEPKTPAPPPITRAGGKGDCRTEYAPRPTRDPNPMCKIDGGSFTMGGADTGGEGRHDSIPARKVTLSPYYIDQFEVTAAQVAHYLNATGDAYGCTQGGRPTPCFGIEPRWSDGQIVEQDGRFAAKPGMEDHPIGQVRLEAAERYCAWAGKELPTEAQWEFAARHDPQTGKDLAYPWGDTFDRKKLACCEADRIKGRPVAVGSFDGSKGQDGRSPWGVHDMAGNARELVRGCYRPSPDFCPADGCTDPVDPAHGKEGCGEVVRSSSAGQPADRAVATYRHFGGGDGFRCARR
jgi:iron(II)-dependent oxidoreductase